MNSPSAITRPKLELLEMRPEVVVKAAEYERLLGYPPGHILGEREIELSAAAREFYARNGKPWVYMREVELFLAGQTLRLDGVEFESRRLTDYLRNVDASRAVLVAVSAGRSCEDEARRLWEESKPDEYFFHEVYGSAVVEHLTAGVSGRICALAESEGLVASAHYSPGYTDWDISDQSRLFELITGGMAQPLPEPLEVLTSGMLKPKKSLLAVVGLSARTSQALVQNTQVPCEGCSLASCQYRRAAYRHWPAAETAGQANGRGFPAPARADTYTLNSRALKKWARERVRLEYGKDGTVDAHFRFDGTTCSNQGRPLAFDYHVALERSPGGYSIIKMGCQPVPGDDGYRHMCAYLSDGEALMRKIDGEHPLRGRPLSDVLGWARASVSSGCYCNADSREHKWGMALEVIHFALSQAEAVPSPSPPPNPP